MSQMFSAGLGLGTRNSKGAWLEVFYPEPELRPSLPLLEAAREILGYRGGNVAMDLSTPQLQHLADHLEAAHYTGHNARIARAFANSTKPAVLTLLEHDEAPTDVPTAYLKLHLMSHRLVKPHQTNLTGLFGVLPNVAWTNQGAVDPEELPRRQLQARLEGRPLSVSSVDKFPRMADYVIPRGVRIADTARVRLGAYLGEGTTVMHEGFVNFNAGSEGPNMVEGRISAGVFVGAGSDLGGSSSTMGTLSGGGNMIISVGRECLLGANSGIGIPLGDRCTVEAGLYITAGTKVGMIDKDGNTSARIKARELAGQSDLLFRRNSSTGAVECLTNRSAIALNDMLHSNH